MMKEQTSTGIYWWPVQQDRGFLLHSPCGNWESSLKVTENICVTTSRDILEAIAKGEGPEDVIIAWAMPAGDQGNWNEIVENAWLSCPATEQILFHTDADKRWEAAAKLIGCRFTAIEQRYRHA